MLNDLIRASPKQHLLWTFLGPQVSVSIKKFEVLTCPPNFTDLSPMYWTNNQEANNKLSVANILVPETTAYLPRLIQFRLFLVKRGRPTQYCIGDHTPCLIGVAAN